MIVSAPSTPIGRCHRSGLHGLILAPVDGRDRTLKPLGTTTDEPGMKIRRRALPEAEGEMVRFLATCMLGAYAGRFYPEAGPSQDSGSY